MSLMEFLKCYAPQPISLTIPVVFLVLLSSTGVVLQKKWLSLESGQSSLPKTSLSPFFFYLHHNFPQWWTENECNIKCLFVKLCFPVSSSCIRFWVRQNHLLRSMLKVQIQWSILGGCDSLGISIYNRLQIKILMQLRRQNHCPTPSHWHRLIPIPRAPCDSILITYTHEQESRAQIYQAGGFGKAQKRR